MKKMIFGLVALFSMATVSVNAAAAPVGEAPASAVTIKVGDTIKNKLVTWSDIEAIHQRLNSELPGFRVLSMWVKTTCPVRGNTWVTTDEGMQKMVNRLRPYSLNACRFGFKHDGVSDAQIIALVEDVLEEYMDA